MKKLLSLILALTLAFSFCCFFASAEEGEPEAYLWLKADDEFAPSITFTIPGNKFTDADYRIITHACFEGCEGEGTAYVNYYVYSKDATGVGDFDHLIQFADFANHKDAGEGWKDLEFTFNPCTGLYGSFKGTTVDPSEIGFVTVGIGFWNATGTVKCSEVRLNKGVEVVWAKSFGGKFDPENDEQVIHSALGTKGTNWGIVKPEIVDNGNIALDAEIEVAVNSDTYNACLNDGTALSQPAYNGSWFAFTRAAAQETIDGESCYVGDVVYDFGEAKTWNQVRANMWEDADAGIGRAKAVKVLYSDDKVNWTEAGELTLGEGSVYWSEGTFDAITSRYVKVQFIWVVGTGSFIMTNEVEVIGVEPVGPIGDDFDGDVNKDGKVNSRDAIYLLRAILNPDKYPIDFSGDVNGDGTANTADAIYLLRHVFFPDEYPLITEPIEPAPVPAEGENIAEGKSYTVDEGYTVRTDGYGDPDLTKLTDGVKETTGSAAPAGFNGTDVNIVVDLGGIGTIDGIITDLQGNAWGIPKPQGYTVNFAVSLDGEEWTDLGAGYQQAVLEQDEGWNVVDFFVNCDGIEARYVRVNYVTPTDYTGDHIWPSEIQVIGTLEEGPEPTESPIYVVGEEGVAEVTDEALAKLLDGVYASDATAFSDARLMNINWNDAFDYNNPTENGSKKATIYYNFDEVINVTGIKLGAFKDRNSFVDLPNVKIYLTTDGETYVRAADGAWTSTIDGLANVTDERAGTPVGEAIYFADWSTRATLAVKGVMIELELVDPFAFLSELEIVTDYVADGALEENIGHAVDTIKLGGVDVAIADATATILTSAAGEISLEATAEGDYRLARAGVITIAKWDDAVKGYRVTFNEVNPWGPLNDGSGKNGNNRTGSLTIADDEIGVFTISSGTIKNAGAGDKWVIWHIEVGDVLYVYDDVIAINHMIDSQPSKNFTAEEPEEPAYQPDPLEELPEDAIVIDFAGYKHAAFVSIVAGDGETVAELTARGNGGTAKDMNYAYNILVDKDNKVVDVDFTLGTACTFTCPEGGYIISYNGNKEGYAAMADIKVGDEITLYNIILDPIADLEGNVELTSAGFTYKTPEIVIDVDTTGWTYVDGEEVGIWQNEKDPVGTYWYKAGIEDGKYVLEVVFDGELTGTADSHGNGKGTNVRIWFHTAKNAAGTDQFTYNSFIDVEYTPDEILSRFMVNTLTDGNKAAAEYAYDAEKPYVLETIVPTALDGLYVKLVFDSIPNCVDNKDLDCIFTVSNNPETGNNALYSGKFIKPFERWNVFESFNFYELSTVKHALGKTMNIVGAAVTGDPKEAGYGSYKCALNDGVTTNIASYSAGWFSFYYSASAESVSNATAGSIGEISGKLGTVVVDLGEPTLWNQVRVNAYAAAGSAGIASPSAIRAYYSADGETWTVAGDLALGEDGTVYMATANFANVVAQYAKVEYLWKDKNMAFLDEVEVNYVGAVAEESEEPEEPSEEEIAFDFNENAVNVKVNESIIGESVRIFTPDYDLSTANLTWAVSVLVKKVDENKYSVISVVNGVPSAALTEDQLVIGVHTDSTGSNVPGAAAARALVAGDILRITGLDGEPSVVLLK